jgi:hypothetical protein
VPGRILFSVVHCGSAILRVDGVGLDVNDDWPNGGLRASCGANSQSRAPGSSGALLDAMVQGMRAMGRVHLDRLPRMADFALWAAACEPALWPSGTFARAYAANRKAAIESIIEADPIANCVRAIMADRPMWTGSASDLLS